MTYAQHISNTYSDADKISRCAEACRALCVADYQKTGPDYFLHNLACHSYIQTYKFKKDVLSNLLSICLRFCILQKPAKLATTIMEKNFSEPLHSALAHLLVYIPNHLHLCAPLLTHTTH